MIDQRVYSLALGVYLLSVVCYFCFLFLKKEEWAKIGRLALIGGWLFHTISFISRWYLAGRPPLTNQFEFASSFAWGIALCFLIFGYRQKYHGLGLFISPIILLIGLYGASLSKDITPIMPALQSRWLFFHVFTASVGYGAFGVAFGLGILFLIVCKLKGENPLHQHLPGLEKLESMIYKTIGFGFLFLTLVIITGAIWAQQTWTRYWAWDPKETWSLITWIIYAIFLHVRVSKDITGKTLAWFSILGFVSVLFTYIGVNVLLPGLHSYF